MKLIVALALALAPLRTDADGPPAKGGLRVLLDFSVDDIASGKAEPVSSASFSIIGVLHVGVGSFDGLDYRDGLAMVADQLNDKTLFFKVDPAADEPLKLTGQRHGYIMPHGVAFSRHRRDHMAVTSYGMNSVIVQPVPASSK